MSIPFTVHAADGSSIVEDSDAIPLDAALARLLTAARTAWPDPTDLGDMPTNLGAVHGDICHATRELVATHRLPRVTMTDAATSISRLNDQMARRRELAADLTRELGNLILTAARYLDDLGIGLPDAIDAATAAQHAYRTRTQE